MRFLIVLTVLFVASVLVGAAAGPGAVTYVDQQKVSEALVKGGPLATGDGYTVSGVHRSAAGQVEVHDKETDIFYISDGEATFITGGTVVGGKTTAPNQLRGTDIQGGETHRLSKGDSIVIPAGTPHWFKEVPKSISYYMVKVIKP
jgi:mannose-6-phosphate isomerase-like protein (cupin superfamily)